MTTSRRRRRDRRRCKECGRRFGRRTGPFFGFCSAPCRDASAVRKALEDDGQQRPKFKFSVEISGFKAGFTRVLDKLGVPPRVEVREVDGG